MTTTTTRLTAASAAELRFAARARAGAPLLLCPLFALLGALPWLSELSPVRLAVSVALLGLSAALGACYRPRRWSVVLRPDRGEIETAGAKLDIALPARITLDACHDDTEAPRGCYVAFIERAGGGGFPLLIAPEPDALLRELHAILLYIPGSVECRWGLPAGSEPWLFEPAPRARAESEHGAVLVQHRLAPISLVRVISVATLLVLLDLTLLVSAQQARLTYVHPLSVALPLAMGSSLVALTLTLATRRVRLTADSWIQSDVGVLGLRQLRAAARVERVRGV
jgi:hypothetical protein